MLDLLRKYRTVVLAACLVWAALLLFSVNLRHHRQTTLFEKMVLQLTAPLQKGVDTACDTLAGWWNRYLWLVDTEQQNERLLATNRQLRADLVHLQEARLANERLRKLLHFKKEVHLPAIPAQVIGEDSSSWFRTVVIDKGSADGIKEGMPVVVADGAVGRIIRSAAHESRVLLITDASSVAAVLVQRTRTRGVCRGRGDLLSLDFALRQEDIKVGDVVITSGTGGVFPKGLLIGHVHSVTHEAYGLFQTVTVTPAVDFSRLEEVLVLPKESR